MQDFKPQCVTRTFTFVLILIAAQTVRATENGQSHADLAYIDTLVGMPLQPGLYIRDDVNYNYSTRFNDQNGKKVSVSAGALGSHPIKFFSSNVANVGAVTFVPEVTIPIMNATFGTALYGFYAVSRAEAQFTILGQTRGSGETRRGLGDLTIVPVFLQWSFEEANLYVKFSPLEFTAPTGLYNPKDEVGNNIGLNYWSYRPALLITYLNLGNELSINLGSSVNSTNRATDYKSGNECYFTYAAQRHLSRNFALGIEGYYYRQISDDTEKGMTVNTTPPSNRFQSQDPLNGGRGNHGEAFALGPVVSYNPAANVFLNAHWVHELFTYNRKQGDSIWVRAAVRF